MDIKLKGLKHTIKLTQVGRHGAKGDPGLGLPAGGDIGDALIKKSGDDFDTEWVASGVVPTWGNIQGNINNQTDLQNSLSAKANQSALSSHTSNTSNPHSVTKAQVGLGSVDNTSDANKPVSTATQTALNGKVDKVAGKGLSTEDYTSLEKSKLSGIETGAEVNNISDTNATDLTDGGASTLHYHASDRNRANHTGNQDISTVTNLQTELDDKLENITGLIEAGANVSISGSGTTASPYSISASGGGGGGGVWGSITGTLSDQTDLVSALSLKSDLTDTVRMSDVNQVVDGLKVFLKNTEFAKENGDYSIKVVDGEDIVFNNSATGRTATLETTDPSTGNNTHTLPDKSGTIAHTDDIPDDLTDFGVTASASELNILDGVTATTAEINYVDGVTSAIQTQINGKVASSRTITAGTGLDGGGDLTANRTISLSSAAQSSLSLADTSVQPSDLGDLASKNLVEVSDIDATGTPSSTTFYRGDGTWDTPAGGAEQLSDLTDVDTSGVSDGDVLTYNSGTSTWVPEAPSGGGGGGNPLEYFPYVYNPSLARTFQDESSSGVATYGLDGLDGKLTFASNTGTNDYAQLNGIGDGLASVEFLMQWYADMVVAGGASNNGWALIGSCNLWQISASNTAILNGVAVKRRNVSGTGTTYGLTNNGSSTTETSFTNNSLIFIEHTTTSVKFYADNVLVLTITTNIYQSGPVHRLRMGIGNATNGSNSTITIKNYIHQRKKALT